MFPLTSPREHETLSALSFKSKKGLLGGGDISNQIEAQVSICSVIAFFFILLWQEIILYLFP